MSHSTTFRNIFWRFKGIISITSTLVVIDALLYLLFPLFIGFAINDLLGRSYNGIISLGALGVTSLIIGSLRRFYDTRAYARIYVTLADEMVKREQERDSDTSKVTARASLLTELVEFLENSMPQIITSLIGLVGILAIIFDLNLSIFWSCLALLGLMIVVYFLTSRQNFRFNKNYNDELEQRVTALESKEKAQISTHFSQLMRWNIRLSDLETLNFAVIWLGIIALLVYTPIAALNAGNTNYGMIFSILMYVFQYIESVVSLPLFIQQMIRLQEITKRLAGNEPALGGSF